MKRQENRSDQQQIILEYLTGTGTYAELSAKYGVKLRTIQTWVRKYRQRSSGSKDRQAEPTDKGIKKRLAQAELKNELLEEMLRLSEELTGIDLRKKFGSGQ